jgi:hypothetical protein
MIDGSPAGHSPDHVNAELLAFVWG